MRGSFDKEFTVSPEIVSVNRGLVAPGLCGAQRLSVEGEVAEAGQAVKVSAATTTTHLPGGRGAELRFVGNKIHRTFVLKERLAIDPENKKAASAFAATRPFVMGKNSGASQPHEQRGAQQHAQHAIAMRPARIT
jgi:hypothetical protein